MNTPRLPRFKRVPPDSDIELTDRDRDIVRLVNRHRFLYSSHISALLGRNSQQIVRRLQLLYHHGYLERPRCQLDYFHRGGSRRIVYGIGSRGADLLSREHGLPIGKIRWGEKNRSVGRVHLEHALFVSEAMLAIQLACQQRGIRVLLDKELSVQGSSSFRWKVNVNSHLKLGVIPDGVFGLEFPDQNGILQRAYFFLEADRGTMPVMRQNLSQSSFYRKLLAYEATWSQSLHTTKFGFHRFRVLTVTSCAARVKSLVDACSQLERGHGLFLFADRSVLENPENLLSSIWQNGRGESTSVVD